MTSARHRLGLQLAAAPDDRALRQVYADALLEEGGGQALRGELIQLELSGKTPPHELVESVRRWRDACGLDGLDGAGLARSWLCSVEQLATHAAIAFAEEPLLRRLVVCIGSARADTTALAVIPELTLARELSFSTTEYRSSRIGSQGLAVLLSSSNWPRLEVLELAKCGLDDAGATLLANSATISELTALDLSDNEIGEVGVRALARSPRLARLGRLVLSGNPAGAGLAALAAAENRMRLERLDLHQTGMTADLLSRFEKRFPGIVINYLPPPEVLPDEDEDDTFTKGPFV
jgi:uncharacterized protein (TIGR02996 family)